MCVALCEGWQDDPICAPGFFCFIANDSVLNLCLPTCDPLLQDCPEDDVCLPQDGDFVCGPDKSREMGAFGDPCEKVNACDAGLLCMSAENVPGCMAESCCSPLCDTGEPNTCPGVGQVCTPWYEEDMAPPGYETLGVCGIPQ